MIPEAPPKQTEDGLVAVGGGWFVLNARDARWSQGLGRQSVTFTGSTEFEADTYFPQLGVNLAVLGPGEPNSMYLRINVHRRNLVATSRPRTTRPFS